MAMVHHHPKSIAPYEWLSAKSKPHARIISRQPPPMVGSGSGAMTDVSGLTRYGVCNSPRAVLLGRPPDSKLDTSGGKYYSELTVTGKGKPHALVTARPKMEPVGSGTGNLANLFGMSRFGRANPPRAVIITRHPVKEKIEQIAEARAFSEPPDKRIGITMKGWPEAAADDECGKPSPGFYTLPPLGKGPAVSLKGRHYMEAKDQSPGPVYDTRTRINTRKGMSMTFKPFPQHEGEVLPGPSHYGRLPGDEAVNQTLTQYPRIKFAGKGFTRGRKYTKDTSSTPGPGPAAFNISDMGKEYGPKAMIVSRLSRIPDEPCGSNRLENLFGKTRFGPASKPTVIFAGRYEQKNKDEADGWGGVGVGGSAGTGTGPGLGIRPDTRIGITIKSRIPEIGASRNAQLPGPGSYNLPDLFGKRPDYSIVKKYVHDSRSSRVRVRSSKTLDCIKEDFKESDYSDCNQPDMLAAIDACIKQVEAVRDNDAVAERDPYSLIPFLRQYEKEAAADAGNS